jgi:hypothetical protein
MEVPVLVPWAEGVEPLLAQPAPRAGSLAGARVGIVDNGWHCMHVLTDVLAESLVDRFGVGEVVVKHTSGSLTLPAADRAELIRACQAVVVGIGTCGSCTRWVLKDAVALERAGVPTVSLYTEAFAALSAILSTSEGMPSLPTIVLPHPLNPLPDDEIRSVATANVDAVVTALVGSGQRAAA